MDYREDVDVIKMFRKVAYKQIIVSIIPLLIAFDIYWHLGSIVLEMQWAYYAVCSIYILCSIVGIASAFITKKLPEGEFCCFTDGTGIYNTFLNYFNICFALLFNVITRVLGYENAPDIKIFLFVSCVFLQFGMYGMLWSRTHFVVSNGRKVYVMDFKGFHDFDITEIGYYTNSFSIGGYKSVDRHGKAIFRWATFWCNGPKLRQHLDNQGVQYRLRFNRY